MKFVNPRNILSLFFIFILSWLSLSLATTISPSLKLSIIHNFYDIRISGLLESGWSTPDFAFEEPRIAASSAKINITYAPPFDKNSKYSEMEYYINSVKANQQTIGNNVLLTTPQKNTAGIKVEAKALEPIVSEKTGNILGAKYLRIDVSPRFLLLSPTLSFALMPFLAVSLALLLFCLLFFKEHKGRLPLWPAIVAAPLIGWFLGQNRFDYWHRGVWIWLFITLALCGFLIYRKFSQEYFNQNDTENRKVVLPLLLIIFAGGLFIRFQGLDFGLPGLFHPDESRKIRIIRTIVKTGDMNPGYFRHPTFLLYASAFNSWVYSKFTGEVPDTATAAYLGRCVSATLGSLSVLFLFLIGQLLFSSYAGLLASAFLAFSPLHVISSRYIKEDASLLFFTLVCFYFAVLALKNKCSIKYLMLSALFGGFSASSKYSGLLSIIFPALVIYERSLVSIQRLLPKVSDFIHKFRFASDSPGLNVKQVFYLPLLLIIIFAGGFLIFTPYSILDSAQFLHDFYGEKQHMQRGHTVAITAISYYWGFHIERSIFSSFQIFFAITAFIGIGFLAARGSIFNLLVISSIFLFYLPAEYVKAKPEPQPERYILPCIPFMALAASALLTRFYLCKNQVLRVIAYGLTALALIQIMNYSIRHTKHIKNDTRQQARKWVAKNIPLNSKIIIDWHFYGPPKLHNFYEVLQFKDKAGAKLSRTVSAETFKNTGYDWLILSSFTYGRFFKPAYRIHNASKRYRAFFNEMKPVRIFKNQRYSYGFHNPEIRIYKIKNKK